MASLLPSYILTDTASESSAASSPATPASEAWLDSAAIDLDFIDLDDPLPCASTATLPLLPSKATPLPLPWPSWSPQTSYCNNIWHNGQSDFFDVRRRQSSSSDKKPLWDDSPHRPATPLHCQADLSPELLQHIDNYFSPAHPTSSPATTAATAPSPPPLQDSSAVGKGVPVRRLSSARLCVVELNGRSEVYYYYADAPVQIGQLVIVEADRGQDLGKIGERVESSQVSRDLVVRRLYRLATEAEIATLPAKAHDEAKALLVCQTKIKEKNLPMQVVSAEYQWDRRKLTFHFVAEERVDFRELVRDMFKLYKTRIWMCAAQRPR